MQILESYCQGKSSPELCEDRLFIGAHYVAVIDGVSAKGGFLHEARPCGWWAARLVQEVLETAEAAWNVQQFIAQVNRRFAAFYAQVHFTDSIAEAGLQAACVVFNQQRRELWLIGDCQALVSGQHWQREKKSDLILAELRSLILHMEQSKTASAKHTTDLKQAAERARSLILPFIRQANCFANQSGSNYAYAVLNGSAIPDTLIDVVPLSPKAQEIVLASDGYPRLGSTLAESEAYLQGLLRDDPLCYRLYPATKGLAEGLSSFDDRTFVKIFVKEEE